MAKQKLTTIWSHRPYSPYVMGLATEATVFGFRKVFPKSPISYGVNYYENGQNTYLYLEKEYFNTANALAQRATVQPDFFLKVLQTAFRKAVILNRYSRLFTPIKVKAASNKTLINWIERFSNLFREMYVYGTVSILVGYSQDNILYTTAEKILKKKTKVVAGSFARFYIILTNQPQLNRNRTFELEIIKLAKRAVTAGHKNSILIKKHYRSEIKKLINEYKWLSYDLCDQAPWDENYVVNLIIEKIKGNLDDQWERLTAYKQKTRTAFEEATRELKLTAKEINVFECIRNLGYYKWAREYEFTEALWRLKIVQDELGRRLNINSVAIKYLLPSEYSLLLKNINKYKLELPRRVKKCLMICDYKKGNSILTDNQAGLEWNKIKSVDKTKKKAVLVKGSPAYSGIVRGTVRIINSVRHVSKISVGDVLIAVTTNPALLPAMKKAAAIVTNEGGITSHAAIVSRELQIPCIVGAKNATKIFKDGQLVEVDAKHGVIKRVG